jgi:NAD(P)H dehydrogenase (quinone)
MNIGIILYSETGNTYSVSQKLKGKLVKAGHSANTERLKVIGKVKPRTKDIKFESIPDIEPYDALVFSSLRCRIFPYHRNDSLSVTDKITTG